jgi:hypothetical protein
VADDADIADLNPAFKSRLDPFLAALAKAGINANVISGYRSPELQSRLYANYQARQAGRPLPFPQENQGAIAAPPWRSFHNYGLAADVTPSNPADYSRMWSMAPQFGLTALGKQDMPHFQMGGDLASDIAQYHLANWRPASQPAPASGAVAYAGPSTSSAAPSSTTLNSSAIIDTLSKNIAGIESGGFKNPYEALNPDTHAIGKYQVMPSNVAGWTLAATGQSMTPDEFRASPAAQEAVFRDQMQRNLQLYGPKDAASIWFTGKPYNVAGGAASDVNKTTNASYVARATAGLPDSATFTPTAPGTTINASGAPTLPAGGPAAAPATGQPGQPSGGLAGQLATALKPLSGGQGAAGGGEQADEPRQMQLPQAPMARALGGPMMMGPGGMNAPRPETPGLLAAAFGGQTPAAPPPMGAATGIPGLPGTTLNSPSQLQMALMTGSMSPYDMYANAAAYGGGFGSS